MFSPRVWGCTVGVVSAYLGKKVFPTGVGVYRGISTIRRPQKSFPHGCGGVPNIVDFRTYAEAFSPRVWGCTADKTSSDAWQGVFPTGVGVYRLCSTWCWTWLSFPHGCGGVPHCRTSQPGYGGVFPTGVGVYRIAKE